MLRLLASVGFLDEVAERTFAANDVTDFANTPGMTGGLRHAYAFSIFQTQLSMRLILDKDSTCIPM